MQSFYKGKRCAGGPLAYRQLFHATPNKQPAMPAIPNESHRLERIKLRPGSEGIFSSRSSSLCSSTSGSGNVCSPAFIFHLTARTLAFNYRNLRKCSAKTPYRKRFFAFSKNPFEMGFTFSSHNAANSWSFCFCALFRFAGTSTPTRTCKSPCP